VTITQLHALDSEILMDLYMLIRHSLVLLVDLICFFEIVDVAVGLIKDHEVLVKALIGRQSSMNDTAF